MKLLVAWTLEPKQRAPVGVAERLLAGRDGTMVLLHVAEPDPEFVGWEAGPQVVRDQQAAGFRREHRELQGEANRLRELGFDVTALLVQGPTAETIVAEAERLDVDFVVVGSHRRHGLAKAFLGSVSERVVRLGSRPVIVVPPT